ncbi:guanosine-5'-triphosphate,3'-diphosphate diphosphatase [Saccharobesus litoralis]|uniref:Guanosine-5'-triphosphate,3'-diphosphate diphosphatase n=1 Tax=Saccharobesus litoralis TaxID=2172099 RepID=A0A2S0VXD1_9ALTE|nr:guanosine-5'-triphosphate,3'-diphosphate diphosphatase [Saccharobesus litoralis]AWB68835.1 guanosine-5'-triphosphate,3'-diphosphate diphosphatase [Saccharobesus litoralis]
MTTNNPVYAAIDLGSNSFHMLLVRSVGGSVQTIGKIKRKVRLASGLDENNNLSHEAMARGWDCLSLFAERLQDIPASQVRIVGTATLRLAKNVDVFLAKAQAILGHPINIISGEDEAKLIYIGVAHTSGSAKTKLVVDIGGASTELVVGQNFEPKVVSSLDIGCVTFLKRFFADEQITRQQFDSAINHAQQLIAPLAQAYIDHGWRACLGASGTPQAIQECLIAQGDSELITLEKMEALMMQAIQCGTIDKLNINGLAEERRLVFVSGLSILIAIFRSLNINYLVLAGGALREGLIYGMLPCQQNLNIRQRTTNSFIERYQLDPDQARRVKESALALFDQTRLVWNLAQHDARAVLTIAAQVQEIGFAIDFKKANKHSAYILSNTAIPGFSLAQRKLIIALVSNCRADIEELEIKSQTMTSPVLAAQLTVLLRLAVLITMRRKDEVLPHVQAHAIDDASLVLNFAPNWLAEHPLMAAELEQEVQHLKRLGFSLKFS